MKTGPTAINPPLYPLFLALCAWLFRTPVLITYRHLISWRNIIVNALVPALLPRVSIVLFGTPAPGIAGGALSIAALRLIPGWDANYTQLSDGSCFCLVSARLARDRGYSAWNGAIAGATLGILFLLSQVVLLVALPWIGLPADVQRTRWREALRFLTPMLLAAILVVLPWFLRNYGDLGPSSSHGRILDSLSMHSTTVPRRAQHRRRDFQTGVTTATHPEQSVAGGSAEEDGRARVRSSPRLRRRSPGFSLIPIVLSSCCWPESPILVSPASNAATYAAYMMCIITVSCHSRFLLMLRTERIPATIFLRRGLSALSSALLRRGIGDTLPGAGSMAIPARPQAVSRQRFHCAGGPPNVTAFIGEASAIESRRIADGALVGNGSASFQEATSSLINRKPNGSTGLGLRPPTPCTRRSTTDGFPPRRERQVDVKIVFQA